jgi:hypothetical protein
MMSPDKRQPTSDSLVDLERADYIVISSKIKEFADKAQLEGRIGPYTEIHNRFSATGAVNEGGFENIPWLADKIGNALSINHSFDIALQESKIPGIPRDQEIFIRIYGDNGYDFHVGKISSEDEYVPFWAPTNGEWFEAESPDGGHTKLTSDDIKAILWCLTHSGDERAFDMLDDRDTVAEAALFAIHDSESSAHTFMLQQTFSTEDFAEQIDNPDDAIPGSSLSISKIQVKESESRCTEFTDYLLTTKHSELAETPDDTEDIWIWITYTFSVRFDEFGVLERCSAFVDIDFKIPEEELLQPQYWVEYQRQKHQNSIRNEFPGIMSDALADIFTDRTETLH